MTLGRSFIFVLCNSTNLCLLNVFNARYTLLTISLVNLLDSAIDVATALSLLIGIGFQLKAYSPLTATNQTSIGESKNS